MVQHLTGLTPEHRQRTREEVLSTSQEHLDDFADALQEALAGPSSRVAIVGPDEQLGKVDVALLPGGVGMHVERL